MLFILGIIIAVFLEFLLLLKKNKSKADTILAIWLALLAIHQLFHYLQYTGEIFNYTFLMGIEFPMPILHGILLFFYVSELTNQPLKKGWSKILHFIAPLSVFVAVYSFFSLSPEDKIAVFENGGAGYEWQVIYYNSLIVVSGIFYATWSFIKIQRHSKNIQESFSNTDKKELQWLQLLNIGLAVIWVLVVFFNGIIIFSGISFFVLFIGFFGINQLNIFNTNQAIESIIIKEDNSNSTEASKPKRYAKSGLTSEMSEKIYKDLNNLMIEDSVFKQENLSLIELAKKLDVHPNHLSQVINERENKNFYYYINHLRIQEFINLSKLEENKNFTLLHLAFECGFNSKTTFNKHFKAIHNMTPSAYFK